MNGHKTRMSDAGSYDEVCVNCGATDARWDSRLNYECPNPRREITALVCGGRDFNDEWIVETILETLKLKGVTRVVHGGARGADSIAGRVAGDLGMEVVVFPADWSKGKIAGRIRNQQMLDEGKPDMVVAFPGGRGTADMINRAQGKYPLLKIETE